MGKNNELRNCLNRKCSEICEREERGPCREEGSHQKREKKLYTAINSGSMPEPISLPPCNYFFYIVLFNGIFDAYKRIWTYFR